MLARLLVGIWFAVAIPGSVAANSLGHNVECTSGSVNILIDMELIDPLDPSLLSLEVVRNAIGNCDSDATVATLSLQLPLGVHRFTLEDDPGEGTYRYDLVLRGGGGNEVPTYQAFDLGGSPHVQDDDYAYCGNGPIITGMAVAPIFDPIERCPGDCGDDVFLSSIPPIMESLGGFWSLWGFFFCTFEGCFLAVTDQEPVSCTVPTQAVSFGVLKSRF